MLTDFQVLGLVTLLLYFCENTLQAESDELNSSYM